MPPTRSQNVCGRCRTRKRKCSGEPPPCKLCSNLARETGQDALSLCVFPTDDCTETAAKLRQAHAVLADMVGKLLPLQQEAAHAAERAEKEAQEQQSLRRKQAIDLWTRMNIREQHSEKGMEVYRAAAGPVPPEPVFGPKRPGEVLNAQEIIKAAGFTVEKAPMITSRAGSAVWVVCRDSRLWVCKIPNTRTDASIKSIEAERQWLQWCTGVPNVVQLGGSAGALQLAGQTCALVTEYVHHVPYQELGCDTVHSWTTRKALGCMRGLFRGVAELHTRGFIHGSLSPRSVLIHLDRSNVTIVNLERARMQQHSANANQLYGDPGFRAPELHRAPAQRHNECLFRIEVWAAGLTCVCMMLCSNEVWTQEELGPLDWRTGTRGHMQDARAHAVAQQSACDVRTRTAGASAAWRQALRSGLPFQEAWFEWLGSFPLHCQHQPRLKDGVIGRASARECLQTLAKLTPD